MLQAFRRFIDSRPSTPRETPELLAELAALYRLECRRLIESAHVPARFAGILISDILSERHRSTWLPAGYVELARVLDGQVEQPNLLAIGGDRGTGKTQLGCSLINTFCGLNRPALYLRVADYFGALGSAAWEQKEAVRAGAVRPALLVLDEVQVRDTNREWQDNELTTLIDRRYGEKRSTLLLSNLKPDALEKNVGASVWRRITDEGGVYETDWGRLESLRIVAQT
jgi:hypothetical protein